MTNFYDQRHGTVFFVAILDGIFFALTVLLTAVYYSHFQKNEPPLKNFFAN
jgi:hypothetical protein